MSTVKLERKGPATAGVTEHDSVALYVLASRPKWIDYTPSSWRPYIQLTRLNTPAPILLIYFPHIYGILHTAALNKDLYPTQDILYACLLLLGGSFFYSNAAHAWDDIVDVPVDRKMERTKNRPLARGTISLHAALLFTLVQAIGAASFLLFLPPITTLCTVPSVLSAIYYPWAKRHTHFPQVVLGFCLSWGIITGSASLGGNRPWEDLPKLCLVLAYTLCVAMCDTIYAHMDVPDDLRLGLKSTAVLFNNHLKSFIWSLLIAMVALLHCCGVLSGMGLPYFVIAEGGCLVSLGLLIHRLELDSTASCSRSFTKGSWLSSLLIGLGLLAEYLCG